MKKPPQASSNDAEVWKREAIADRERRKKETAAMCELTLLVERLMKKEVALPVVLLAFHHVAMEHGSYAHKMTMRVAHKSSIEELSQVAPAIFPPDRVPKL